MEDEVDAEMLMKAFFFFYSETYVAKTLRDMFGLIPASGMSVKLVAFESSSN